MGFCERITRLSGIFEQEINHSLRAGLVDVHMRAPGAGPQFKFLHEINDLVTSINNFFNMGTEFSRLMEAVKELADGGLDIKGKLPRFFSDTRFANHVSKIYSGVVENYPAIIMALTEVQEESCTPGASDSQKKKGERSAGIQAKAFNLRCTHTVCGLTDVYNKYAVTVCILQEVNILPHVKFDKFETGCRQKLEEMQNSVELSSCCCSQPQAPGGTSGDITVCFF